MRLILLEDTEDLGEGIARHFRQSGHAVDWARTFAEANAYIRTESYDLAILDIMLPDGDGRDILARLRSGADGTPVLVLTARSQVADRVHTLDLGADDYLTKPFDIAELDARCRAIVRRRTGHAESVLRLGRLEYDSAGAEVRIGGRPIPIRTRELRLLEAFLAKPNTALSKSALMEKLFALSETPAENAVELYVSRLRKRIENSGLEIRTVRGIGYKLRES